ncbi:MAG: NADH-quinone oxidoreductase subunit M [Chitinophagaceae bacterium]|nr:NADH-quinone oxidoreductase subunit M [Chitinophagaceae bacterium]
MLGNYYTFPELLIWVPLVMGLVTLFIRNSGGAKLVSLFSTFITLGVSIIALNYSDPAKASEFWNYNNVSYYWLRYLGASFTLGLNGPGFLFTFLTTLVFVLTLLISGRQEYEKPNIFYGLLLFWQAAIMGVFTALDALVLFFFWTLALLIPFFLMGKWGDSWKFGFALRYFIYLFTGAVLLLAAILFLYPATVPVITDSVHSFTITALYSSPFSIRVQVWAFGLMTLAFLPLIPVFPFHTWFPGAVVRSPYPVAMIVSALLVTMGAFAFVRWGIPLLPVGFAKFQKVLIILALISVVYSGFIALVQDDLKRLAAWASIAHIGLAVLGIFLGNADGLKGGIFELFNHGIVVTALWMVVYIIEDITGERRISSLGGLYRKAPFLTIFSLLIFLGFTGTPMTGSFHAGWMVFTGMSGDWWLLIPAGAGVLVMLLFMLNMLSKVFFGSMSEAVMSARKMSLLQTIALVVIVVAIVGLGVYPDFVTKLLEIPVANMLKGIGG